MPYIGAYKGKSPCLDCKDRWINETGRCHSNCERYLDFKAKVVECNRLAKEERARERKDLVQSLKTVSQLNRIERGRKR